MISKYLKSKNLIDQVRSNIDETELESDKSDPYYYLKASDQSSFYYYYRNLFNNYEIEKILAIGNKLPKEGAVIGGTPYLDKSYRDSIVSWIPINDQTIWIYQKLTGCIIDVNESFFELDLTKIEKLQFTSYYGNKDGTGFYDKHVDSCFGFLPDNRKLSFVMQLSDPNDYEGGELRLYTGRDPICIKKEKGLITFFHSCVLHECTPVTSGNRHTLVGWVHGPKIK
jgi:PKHD-type hydroxylase